MQLDQTRITIRERGIFDLLDLGLRVMWVYGGPLAIACALGILPLLAINTWLLSGVVSEIHVEDTNDFYAVAESREALLTYLFALGLLVVFEMPLATAPLTLYLGNAVFEERPSFSQLWRNFWEMFPQLLFSRVLVRGLWLVVGAVALLPDMQPFIVVTFFLMIAPFLMRPYATEVILLERNPFSASKPGEVTTGRRNAMLHAGTFAELFSRWFLVVIIGGAWLCALAYSAEWLLEQLSGESLSEVFFYRWIVPVALWLVVTYAAVVRFLSYLDLRIRREGWEVELRMRAEGNRLARQLT